MNRKMHGMVQSFHSCFCIYSSSHTPAISQLLSGLNGSFVVLALHPSSSYRLCFIAHLPLSAASIRFFQRTGSVFELAAGHSVSSQNVLENKVAWQHRQLQEVTSALDREGLSSEWISSYSSQENQRHCQNGSAHCQVLSAPRKADLYVLVCQLCCLSFLALCSATESDCLAAIPLLCCLCFQRKEDGWNFIQPEHCSHARLVFINDASHCHSVRSPNQ